MNLEKPGIMLKRIHFVRLLLAVILINLALFAFLVLPNRARLTRLQADYSGLRTQVAEESKNIQNLEQRLQNLQQSRKDLDEIYTKIFVPKKKGAIDIRLELEQLVRNRSTNRADFSYSYTALPEHGLQLFTLGVPVEGTYDSIRALINDIEKSQHFLILNGVDLSKERKGEKLTLDFRISTYLVDDEI